MSNVMLVNTNKDKTVIKLWVGFYIKDVKIDQTFWIVKKSISISCISIFVSLFSSSVVYVANETSHSTRIKAFHGMAYLLNPIISMSSMRQALGQTLQLWGKESGSSNANSWYLRAMSTTTIKTRTASVCFLPRVCW